MSCKVLFVGEGTVSDDVRCKLPGVHLSKLGYDTEYSMVEYRDEQVTPAVGFDVAIFSRPHHDSLMLAFKRMGTKVIVDIDDDFHSIPKKHPGYTFVGEGDSYYLMKLDNCIYLADMIVASTETLKNRIGKLNGNIKIIPNGWSADNFNWLAKRSIYTDRFIIGWGGTITHREDFHMCVNPLIRFVHKHPETMICIVGDTEIYNMLNVIPERQKLYVPMVDYQVYPAVMGLWDVLLAPLLDNPFNQAKTDIKLLEAGAKGIPYICSDVFTYSHWQAGGLHVGRDSEEWLAALEKLYAYPEEISNLSSEGHNQAKDREMGKLVHLWKEAIDEVSK